jgi:hypothetical protein
MDKTLISFKSFAKFSLNYERGNQRKNVQSMIFALDLYVLCILKYFRYTTPYFKLKGLNLDLQSIRFWPKIEFVYKPSGHP